MILTNYHEKIFIYTFCLYKHLIFTKLKHKEKALKITDNVFNPSSVTIDAHQKQ
jgi:hypothetical protein